MACTSGEMENENEKFSPSLFFSIKFHLFAVITPNHRVSFIAQLQLHPLLLFRLYLAKLLLLSLPFHLFFLHLSTKHHHHQNHQSYSPRLPFFTNNNVSSNKRSRYLGYLIPVNAGTVPGYNSGPLYFYPSPQCANI